jgi:hypothetical protein
MQQSVSVQGLHWKKLWYKEPNRTRQKVCWSFAKVSVDTPAMRVAQGILANRYVRLF